MKTAPLKSVTEEPFPPFFLSKQVSPKGVTYPRTYIIFTSDIPQTQNTNLATYANDTSILSANTNSVEAFQALQLHLDLIGNWSTKWRIKINAEKSCPFHPQQNKYTYSQPSRSSYSILVSVKYLGIYRSMISYDSYVKFQTIIIFVLLVEAVEKGFSLDFQLQK